MTREDFNRYENDKKHKKGKRDKKIRHPASKGSVRSREKRNLKNAMDIYNIDIEDDIED